MRYLLLLVFGLVLSWPAHACDLSTDARSPVLADYADNALSCLRSPEQVEFGFDASLEGLFIQRVNDERRQEGLAPVRLREAMRPAARFHSLDMGFNGFFGHDSPMGRDHVFRVSAFDRTLLATSSAENVAQFGPIRCRNSLDQLVSCTSAPGFKPPTAQAVVEDLHRKLMASEGHRANILDPQMTHIAVGVAVKETGYYVTQIFVRPVGELSRPLPERLRAGGRLRIDAQVPGWEIANLALSRDASPTDLETDILPAQLRGDYRLRPRVVQTVENGSNTGSFTTRWIYPTGPSFTAEPVRETSPLP